EEEEEPLLGNDAEERRRTLVQEAISRTFRSTAHLANLLPTGSVLAFQLLVPIFSNEGRCDRVGRFMTAAVVALCGLSCFLLCFTDSVRGGRDGNPCYGFATPRGLWMIDGSPPPPPGAAAERYRLRFVDFVHAFMSIAVFAAVAMFDRDTVACFWPEPSGEAREVIAALPVGIGVVCSMMFVVFPTKRHGIGFPVT
ncbi:hypothetical protein M569_07790, partial [Genlisea aurea]